MYSLEGVILLPYRVAQFIRFLIPISYNLYHTYNVQYDQSRCVSLVRISLC